MIKPPCKKCRQRCAGCKEFCSDWKQYISAVQQTKRERAQNALQACRLERGHDADCKAQRDPLWF